MGLIGGWPFEFLADSLSRAATHFNERRNSAQLHISGCVALLQIWAIEHLSLRPASNATSFPRFLKWTEVDGRRNNVLHSFEHNKIVNDLVASAEDLSHEVLVEAINEAERGFRHSRRFIYDTQDHIHDYQTLVEQNKHLQKRVEIVEDELRLLKDQVKEALKTKRNDEEGADKEVVGDNVCQKTPGVSVPLDIQKTKKEDNKHLQRLYTFCTRRVQTKKKELLVKLPNAYLTREDMECMKPKVWLSNMVIDVAARFMMEDDEERSGVRSRFLFSPAFVIFAPTIYQGHWFCYVLDQCLKKIFVLDSLLSDARSEELMRLDFAMKTHFEELLALIYPGFPKVNLALENIWEDLPKQHNCDDCGIYVLKYMEIWDGMTKWGDKTMPNYSQEEIDRFRREFVCRWVLHSKNECRTQVLSDAKLPTDLSM